MSLTERPRPRTSSTASMDGRETRRELPQDQPKSFVMRWFREPLERLFPGMTADQLGDVFQKFNVANILFCYCIPFFYVFYPALLMPAIFLRSLSLVVGWLYRLVLTHHHATFGPKRSSPKPNMQRASSSYKLNPPDPEPSSDNEMNNMYFWLQRCSICLDQTYSLCLESCRDQFCKDCFARYVEETVNASWGLGITRIQCPVCKDPIPVSEWSRYVSPKIVNKYQQFNQPYRSFARHCVSCDIAVTPCLAPHNQDTPLENRLNRILEDLDEMETRLDNGKDKLAAAKEVFRQACQKGMKFRIGRVQDLYNLIIPVLCRLVHDEPQLYAQASHISKQLVALEVVPEAWKQTQFWHIANFPIEPCSTCGQTICLHCGGDSHKGNCLDHLRCQLMEISDEEGLATIQWKLDHTRSCPNCHVMINRDEGCNKVDCLFCGYRFCWKCGCGWSQQKCGFYQCGKQQAQQEKEEEEETSSMGEPGIMNSKVELGVPDMSAIDARRHAY
ncbi:uncharacterized protein BYT42DRAFT_572553 [Radiomyces spectabilis]|uniref:uncharacterized protein n=1 Tax=Radiomyces spectabilis TaxID=64574 RepID=UPI00221ECF14|nr:uncharacterized protein BYT42DRAFT_572553 [Radiomyces spectabilis]KAI8378053.1 hypothetical protein BYT42DRAFT_572553 [Radiomyces spectabilis]